MANMSSTLTQVTSDIATCAAAVAPLENRSFAEQVNYRARIGMQVERAGSLTYRHALAVADGREQFSSLSDAERVIAHGIVDARIAERAATEHIGEEERAAGRTTVSLDTEGRVVEISPDGTSS